MRRDGSERGVALLMVLLVVAIGVALNLLSLGWGFFCDDYGHQAILRGHDTHPNLRPWNLYDFGNAPAPGDDVFEFGTFPWWTSSDWKARFLRPVTSLTLWLDHTLFGSWAPGWIPWFKPTRTFHFPARGSVARPWCSCRGRFDPAG